jgi:uncharacterized protein
MDEILASIRRILAEEAAAPPPPRSRAAAEILDLTEAVNDDGSVRHIEPAVRLSAEAPIPPLPGGRVEPAVSRPEASPGAARLVSDAASDAVAASFARLAGLAQETRRDGKRDLDVLVQETLRPLLQAWLDEHLPSLVERLVRDEIARVVGQSGPSAT